MKRLIQLGLALALAVPAATATSDITRATGSATIDFSPIVQEYSTDGTSVEEPPRVGGALLVRRDDRLGAVAHIQGLVPGGVYTFWWVVVQGDGTFPDDIFVARGGGKVVRTSGRATTFMRAALGQAGITGFMPDGVNEIGFASLADTTGSTVRIEIAYHGQADDAGPGEVDAWLRDFWTGAACPPATPNPNPGQPHCPVYYAATFQ